jgi:hypothetical protein
VWAEFVVAVFPAFILLLVILKRHEPFGVEAFIPEAAVERFDMSS